MMSERSLKAARIVSSVAATFISLACGTNVRTGIIAISMIMLTRLVCLFGMGTPIRREAEALLNAK